MCSQLVLFLRLLAVTSVAWGAALAAPPNILMLGDSLTSGYGLPAEQALPAQLEVALRRDGIEAHFINAGVSGDTTQGALARLDWVLSPEVDGVIVALGGNDGLRGLDPSLTRRNLDAILQRLNARQLPVLLIGMRAPRNLGPEHTTAFDQLFAVLAEKHQTLFYPFLLEGVALVPELNQSDGIHPNAAGVARIVEQVRSVIEQLIVSASNSALQGGEDVNLEIE